MRIAGRLRLHGVIAARLPSVGIFAAPVSVIYNFGIPQSASYHSRQVDIKLSHLSAVAMDGNPQTTATFVMHSGILGSSTEGAVIEEVFSKRPGHGSNTIRLLQLANEQKIPIYHLKAENIATTRVSLQHASEVMTDIDNALNSGLEVIIPKTSQTNGTWTGSGYIMVDPKTGSADYRVSGGLSGDIDDEECQRAVEPVHVTLPDIAMIWWILFGWMVDDDFNFNGAAIATALLEIAAVTILVGLVAVAAPVLTAAVVAGATRVATLVAGSYQSILAILAATGTEMAMAADSCSCTPNPLGERKGGTSFYTKIHNDCADMPDFTDFPGEDVELRDIAYDGLKETESPPGTFYEIKMGMFYGTIKRFSVFRPAAKKFLEALKAKAIYGFYRELIPARLCGYEFRYGARSSDLVADMQQDIISWNNRVDAARIMDISGKCP